MRILKILMYCFLIVIYSCSGVKEIKNDVADIGVEKQFVKVQLFGNEPFWSLSVFNDYAIYKTPESDEVKVKIKWEEEGENVFIKSTSNSLPIRFALENEFCTDGMSDNEYMYSCKETINNLTVTGCVKWFLDDAFKGKWILKQSKGQKITDFDHTPYLDLDASTMRVSGNAGCNGVAGLINYSKGNIVFNYLSTTLMWCDKMEEEGTFIKNLKLVDQFKVENNVLKGYNDNKVILEFIR